MATFGCWNANYEPAIACSGYGTHEQGDPRPRPTDLQGLSGGSAEAAINASQQQQLGGEALIYSCYADSKSKAFPVKRMFDYLDKLGSTPPDPSGSLSTAQALWQERLPAIVIEPI